MERTELPYNKAYAVISAGVHHGMRSEDSHIKIQVEIRNVENSEFICHYDLVSTSYLIKGYKNQFGTLKATSFHEFTLDMLKRATKSLSKIDNKFNKINDKEGYTGDLLTNIMRLLRSAKLSEVRIHVINEYFGGWDYMMPYEVNEPELETEIDKLISLCEAIKDNF